MSLAVLTISTPSYAESPNDALLPVALSLLVVVALIFAVGYVMRRLNVVGHGSRQMQVVASLMVGTRERVVVVKVGEEQHLLGITSQNINALGRLDTPLDVESHNASHPLFAKLLANKMKNNTHKNEGTHE